jgi:hypothetical protein
MTINWSQVDNNTAAGKGGTASGGGIVNVDTSALTGATTSGVLTLRPTVPDGFSGYWGDPEIGWPFSVRFERKNSTPCGFLLSMDRSRRIRFARSYRSTAV